MPELSVTEEQLARIEDLRAEIETTFVEGYGHVRRLDAVDYLLDTHAPPAEERVRRALDRRVRDEDGEIDYPALQSVARNTEGVKGSGMPAEEMYAAVLEARVGEMEAGLAVGLGAAGSAETGDSTGADVVADAGEPDGTDGEETDVDGTGRDDAAPESTDGDDAAAGDDADSLGESEVGAEGSEEDGTDATDDGTGVSSNDGEASSTPSTAASSNGGGSPLQAMMNLLKTHDDKWRKAESGDAPYEVDLPDGGTEAARTKDDVKRILFTNY